MSKVARSGIVSTAAMIASFWPASSLASRKYTAIIKLALAAFSFRKEDFQFLRAHEESAAIGVGWRLLTDVIITDSSLSDSPHICDNGAVVHEAESNLIDFIVLMGNCFEKLCHKVDRKLQSLNNSSIAGRPEAVL